MSTELFCFIFCILLLLLALIKFDDWYNNCLDKLCEKIEEQEIFEVSEKRERVTDKEWKKIQAKQEYQKEHQEEGE